MTRRKSTFVAMFAAATLVVTACGGDDDDDGGAAGTDAAPADTEAAGDTEAPTDTEAATDTEAPSDTEEPADTEAPSDTEADGGGAGWTVSTEDCVDPDAANAPIEGTVDIASAMPLSGGPAAAAFTPVAQGLEAYIDYANEEGLLPDHELTLSIGDDQYDPALTPGVVSSALDSGADLFVGIIGTPNNAAVRDVLNEECVPQLLALTGAPAWGEVEDYPWTTGGLLTYDVESQAYAADIAREFPDGATVALFVVNNDFGAVYREAFAELAGEFNLEIVDEQTIEAPETAPPSAQLSSIAGNAPDAILAAPLGAQCPTFMTELANAKAATPDWDPRVYITNTCASSLTLATAGPAANGLFTSAGGGGIYDINNPENAEIPGVALYLEQMETRGLTDTIPTSASGWAAGEVAVEILRRAAESPEGLTRASIINASRNLEYQPSIIREGIVYTMDGDEDAFYVEDAQIVQYDAETTYFTDIGELISFSED